MGSAVLLGCFRFAGRVEVGATLLECAALLRPPAKYQRRFGFFSNHRRHVFRHFGSSGMTIQSAADILQERDFIEWRRTLKVYDRGMKTLLSVTANKVTAVGIRVRLFAPDLM
jgi:hypothetical protein